MNNSSTLLTTQFHHQYQLLIYWLAPHDLTFIKKRFRPNKWSIHEHLAHLGRYHEIFQGRLERIMEQEAPHFSRYKAEEDEEFFKWCQKETNQIIQDTVSLIHI